jgi:hypothetical protein
LYVFSLLVLRNSALLLNCLQPFKPHLNPLNDPCTADVAAQNLMSRARCSFSQRPAL